MKNFDFIKNKFIDKHKIDNYDKLHDYINFLTQYNTNIDDKYSEKHHILPKSIYPEYSKENWNIVELLYDDHKYAHLLLFESINIRTYQRPLNWMMPYYKNKQLISNAAKRGWEKLKKNKIKFDEFKLKRSKYMSTLSSVEQSRRAKLFWDNITPQRYEQFCQNVKNSWSEEKRIQKSIEMKKYFENEENRKQKSIEAKEFWDNSSDEFKQNFKDKMNIVNKDIVKREKAGKVIKEKWKDPIFLNKMKNRKTKPGQNHIIIYSNNTSIKYNTMQEIINKYNFTADKIRKYRNTNNKIEISDLNENNMELLGAIINKI